MMARTVESSNSIENELNFRVQTAARSTSKVISVNILRPDILSFSLLGKEWHASSVSVFQGMSQVITSHACKLARSVDIYFPHIVFFIISHISSLFELLCKFELK